MKASSLVVFTSHGTSDPRDFDVHCFNEQSVDGIEKLRRLAKTLKQTMAKNAATTDEGEHQSPGSDDFDMAV